MQQSVIGVNLRFVGEIESSGSVRIEGQVQGRVKTRELTIGQGGGIEGDVTAEIARIDGALDGDLAAELVVLGPSARVTGNITARSLAVESGARFEGRSTVGRASTAQDSGEVASAAV